MAEEVSGILGEEGEDQLEGEAAGEGVVEKSPPDLVVDQSPGVGAGGGAEQPGAVAGNVTRLDSYSPAESGSRKPARTLVVTPASTNQGEEPSSGRRGLLQTRRPCPQSRRRRAPRGAGKPRPEGPSGKIHALHLSQSHLCSSLSSLPRSVPATEARVEKERERVGLPAAQTKI